MEVIVLDQTRLGQMVLLDNCRCGVSYLESRVEVASLTIV